MSASEVATIETWASSRYPDIRDGEGRLVVRPRGGDVVLVEQWTERGSERSRQILKLRWVAKSGVWSLHWALSGGRWLGRQPPDAPLEQLLDSIELEQLPG